MAVFVAAVTALTLIISACLITEAIENPAAPAVKERQAKNKIVNGRIYPP